MRRGGHPALPPRGPRRVRRALRPDRQRASATREPTGGEMRCSPPSETGRRVAPEGGCALLPGASDPKGAAMGRTGRRRRRFDRHHQDAGRGGGRLKVGRHVKFARETPLCNYYLALLERMGAPRQAIGDSTGVLNDV